jgi:4-hydroxy-3-methylbut-2-enyl diphosphate reductase
MDIVLSEAHKNKGPLFTYGPLIHNEQVLGVLEGKGIKSVDDPEDVTEGSIVIRAHGIPPLQLEKIKKSGLRVINATCPRVARVQAIIRYNTKKGKRAVIVGDRDHAEVVGLVGYSETDAYVIQNPEDVVSIPREGELFVVAQTTQNSQNFMSVVEALKEHCKDILVFNTICEATFNRQKEVRILAKEVDAVVVVGGFHSGNTLRLAQISKESGKPTFHVETEVDIIRERFDGMEVVGVTAGASTPNWMIDSVVREIESIRGRKESLVIAFLKKAFKTFVLSNLMVASGAFSFAYAVSSMLGGPSDLRFPALAFLYIYAMHVINRFLDKGASAYSDPERSAFLRKHRKPLIFTCIMAMAIAVGLAWSVSIKVFIAVCCFIVLGATYSVRIIPVRIRTNYRYSKIKDIPGSKSISEALAWAAVIVVLPLVTFSTINWLTAAVSFLVVFLVSFTRSVLFEIFQFQGDLIVGSETLPITLGERKTLFMLKLALSASAVFLVCAFILEWTGAFTLAMLLPVIGLSFCLLAYEKDWLDPGLIFEGFVEGNFFVTGLLAVLWQAF